jgi:deoxyadenosine/deoxycytidine kinase
MRNHVVSLIGVHGVGKTYTASILKDKYGFHYIPVEAISSDIVGLPPAIRQIMFFTRYVEAYMSAFLHDFGRPIVMDSHPLMVVAYTYWWLRGDASEDLASSFMAVLTKLPKPNLLVYIRATDPSIVINRILSRNRFNLKEEYRVEYVSYIIDMVEKLLDKYASHVALNTLVVDASLEGEQRAEIIYRKLRELGILDADQPLCGYNTEYERGVNQ